MAEYAIACVVVGVRVLEMIMYARSYPNWGGVGGVKLRFS